MRRLAVAHADRTGSAETRPRIDAWRLGATEIAELVVAGRLSPVALIRSLLDRIDSVEPRVNAWVLLDRDGALAQAEQLEDQIARGSDLGSVAGVPIGLKDIFHVRGMPTRAGSLSTAETVETEDAAVVARWRSAGGVVAGKLQTTEFADADPSPTRNAWNDEHTPGGSSSGSAAAVAAGMIPVAFGTQSSGSTLRPAAYNGIVGFKPSFGGISCYGVIPHSWTLDCVGILARHVIDIALAFDAVHGPDRGDPWSAAPGGRPSALAVIARPPSALRLAVPKTHFFERCEPATRREAERAIQLLASAGATIDEISLPPSFDSIDSAFPIVLISEFAAYHEHAFAARSKLYGPRAAARVKEGAAISAIEYARAQLDRQKVRRDLSFTLSGFDAIVTPATPAPAPRGLSETGDPSFQKPWSFCNFPAISIPTGVMPTGLPAGIQLAASEGRDSELLGVAWWCEQAIGFKARPSSWVNATRS